MSQPQQALCHLFTPLVNNSMAEANPSPTIYSDQSTYENLIEAGLGKAFALPVEP